MVGRRIVRGAQTRSILRGCEEILSEGGSEGRERRIFGYTGSTLPTERRRNHRPRCATNRTVCAIGPSPAGVTEDPSLPPLGPTPLRISSQPLSEAKDLQIPNIVRGDASPTTRLSMTKLVQRFFKVSAGSGSSLHRQAHARFAGLPGSSSLPCDRGPKRTYRRSAPA